MRKENNLIDEAIKIMECEALKVEKELKEVKEAKKDDERKEKIEWN